LQDNAVLVARFDRTQQPAAETKGTEMGAGVTLSRRSFLAVVGVASGGLSLGLAIPFVTGREAPAGNSEINAWLVIGADDSVTVRVARCEMGQGAQTGLAMLVAEELECDWSKVRTEFPDPAENVRRHEVWGDMTTGASQSIALSQLELRQAGAMARQMLVAAAAAQWKVPASECTARSSRITHRRSGRAVSYGAVAAAAAKLPAPDPATIKLKEPAAWTLLGRPLRRLDVRDKVTAQPVYAIDVRLPGMLYAAIAQSPVFGGTLKSVDDSAIAGKKGVRGVVRLPDAVAVVADSWWQAKQALDALTVVWDDHGRGKISTASIMEQVQAGLGAKNGVVGRSDGDLAAGFARAVKRIDADYMVPFLAHSTMEPQTCTAWVKPDGVEVWAPTQGAMTALATAADAAGLPHDKITIHRMLLGGGFGRRGAIQEFIRQAVLIAKHFDRPVKMLWSREEDTQHDFYRPFGMARLAAGLDAEGLPVALSIRLAGPSVVAAIVEGFGTSFVDRMYLSGLAEEMAYNIPNYLVDYSVQRSHVPLGVWRGINYTQNTYYKESFIDEMAHAAGADPYLYRRRLLQNSPKNLAVLDAAAKKAGWLAPLPPGRFRGIAVTEVCGSFCAQVVEISLSGNNVRVHRVVSALDCGHAINPMSIEMQTQGAVVFGLSAVLNGEITIKDGAVEQSNFHDYELLRMADTPLVETVIVPSGDFWGGVGEPPVTPLAPAICNALFMATGKRVRSLPLKNHDLARAS
jgi:isoquinoline 1-oxidoreductase beta subunit